MSQLFKTIFKNKSVFESQIKIKLWKTSSEITSQYLILFHCQKWSPKSSRLQPLRPTCPLRKQTALRAKKIVNFRYQKWKHFVEGFFFSQVELLSAKRERAKARRSCRLLPHQTRKPSERLWESLRLTLRVFRFHANASGCPFFPHWYQKYNMNCSW